MLALNRHWLYYCLFFCMTLQETQEKISSLKHLIDTKVPKWQSHILEIIPAPIDDTFTQYMEMYEQHGNVRQGLLMAKGGQFDILLIFRKPQTGLSLVYEWYGFFYTVEKNIDWSNNFL
jgi:hypothetical protein